MGWLSWGPTYCLPQEVIVPVDREYMIPLSYMQWIVTFKLKYYKVLINNIFHMRNIPGHARNFKSISQINKYDLY